MSEAPSKWLDHRIRHTSDGSWIRVKGLRATLAHYGWDQIDAPLHPATPAYHRFMSGDRGVFVGSPRLHAGIPMRISRSPLKQGNPAGLTNRFRVSSNAANKDLMLLAVRAQGDWHWMTDKNGNRIDREDWLRFAQARGIS